MVATPDNLFQHILEDMPVAPEAMLRAALHAADAADNLDVLRMLVSREDVPAHLAEQHARTRPALVGNYQSRHSQTASDTTRVPERRASVLARALRGATPPRTAVIDALAALSTRPTKTVAEALIVLNPKWFTPEQAAAILANVGEGSYGQINTGYPDLGARLGPDLASEILKTTTSMMVVSSLITLDVPVDVRLHGLVNAAATLTYNGSRIYGYPEQSRDEVVKKFLETLSPDQRTELCAATYLPDYPHRSTGSIPPRIAATTQHLRGSAARPAHPWDLTPAAPPDGRTEVTTLLAARAHATSPDPNVLAQVVTVVSGTKEPLEGELTLTLLRNRAVTISDRHQLLWAIAQHVQNEGPNYELSYRLETQFDAVSAFAGDDVGIGMWAGIFPAQVLTIHGWEPFGGRELAPTMLRDWRTRATTRDYERIVIAAAERGMTTAEVRELPLTAVAYTNRSRHPYARAQTSAAIAQLLTETLGDNADAWHAFNGLYPSFTGTLGELVATARTVAS